MSVRHVAIASVLVACGARSALDSNSEPDQYASPMDAAADTIEELTWPDALHEPDVVVVDAPDFAWYVLDETSGTTAHDSSANHLDITNLAGITWGSGGIFDGATCSEVDVATAMRDPPITMTAWLAPASRSDETTNDYALTPYPPNALSGDIPGLGGYGIGLDVWTDGTPGAVVTVETGVGNTTGFHAAPGAFLAGTEYFVALTADTTTSIVYVDGNVLATNSANDPPNATPTPLHMGCHNDDVNYGTKRFYEGRIRDARIYKRILAASEIAALFITGPLTKAP
jgi:hypothetical protein